jgi:2-keto-3-deoxy-6-phosphogluconate aldolase
MVRKFVKGIKGPQPWTSIMPTGGVAPTKENLEAWFSAGVTCVGMGSKLMAKDANGNFDYEKIEAATKNALDIIKSLR